MEGLNINYKLLIDDLLNVRAFGKIVAYKVKIANIG